MPGHHPFSNVGAFIVAAITFVLSVMLTSCLAAKPTREDVVGVWVEVREVNETRVTKPPFSCFRFFPDGRFKARNIPFQHFMFGASQGRGDASGTWQLDNSRNDPFALHKLILHLEPTPGTPWFPRGLENRATVFPLGSRDEFWTGVEDSKAVYTKKEKVDCE